MGSISETKPVLSNRLADLAERAGEAARAYRRGSIESIEAYLSAGALLAEARGECRRGEWGAVLDRAGVESRTARRMMQAWRLARETGADAAAIHDAGGVQAFMATVLADVDAALHGAADALEDAAGDTEKTVFKTVIEGAVVPDEARIARDVEADAAAVKRVLDRAPASSPARDDTGQIARSGTDTPAPGVPDDGLTAAQRRRQAKRERGECLDCETATDGEHVRCARCRARIAAADKRRREDARLGSVLGVRIRDAARQGRGVRLTAADVAGLVEGERGRFRERLAKVGRSPKERSD